MKSFEMIIHYDRIGDSDMYNCHEVGELVRCKDCKHFQTDPYGRTDCDFIAKRAFAEGELNFDPDDFCSRGERREDG